MTDDYNQICKTTWAEFISDINERQTQITLDELCAEFHKLFLKNKSITWAIDKLSTGTQWIELKNSIHKEISNIVGQIFVNVKNVSGAKDIQTRLESEATNYLLSELITKISNLKSFILPDSTS